MALKKTEWICASSQGIILPLCQIHSVFLSAIGVSPQENYSMAVLRAFRAKGAWKLHASAKLDGPAISTSGGGFTMTRDSSPVEKERRRRGLFSNVAPRARARRGGARNDSLTDQRGAMKGAGRSIGSERMVRKSVRAAERRLPCAVSHRPSSRKGTMVAAAKALARGPTFASGSQRKSCWLKNKAIAALTASATISAPICATPTRATNTR